MSSTEQERQERAAVEAVMQNYPDFPQGQIANNHEDPPDIFISKDGVNIACVEVTRFVRGQSKAGSPQRQAETTWDKIMAMAWKGFVTNHDDPLWVNGFWHFGRFPKQTEIPSIVSALTRLVVDNIPQGLWGKQEFGYEDFEGTPLESYLVSLRVTRVRTSKQALWASTNAGFISTTQDEIQAIIDSKNERVATYQETCGSTWLLIVAEGTSISQTVDMDDMGTFSFRSNFEHVLFYHQIDEIVVPLNLTVEPLTAIDRE